MDIGVLVLLGVIVLWQVNLRQQRQRIVLLGSATGEPPH